MNTYNYTTTEKHRSRIRLQPAKPRAFLNGFEFTKSKIATGTQTNFATAGR